MNPRQRRGVVLLLLAAVGALAVFFTVLSYVGQVRQQVGDHTTAYELDRDVTAFTKVTPDMLATVQIPRRWLPSTSLRAFDSTQALVAATDLKRGSLLQDNMLVPPPELQPGERELAILIDAETGVAGKVSAGALVDIYATFGGSGGAGSPPEQARIIVTNARVLGVGTLEQVNKQNGSGGFDRSQVVPVTFALTPHDSLALSYAESFASKVRLALIAPGTRSGVDGNDRVLNGTQLLGSAGKK
jgi:pilus assembly protein CpaB